MIKNVALVVLSIVWLGGCAGLEMKTLKPSQVEGARSSGAPLDGYVVYEPIVVVEISMKDACLAGKDDKGNCKAATVVQCAASTPFLLPDYAKPYLIASKSGLGKAGVEIAITDGWRLGTIKDASDNTAILGTLEKVLGIKSAVPDAGGATCRSPGLYRVVPNKVEPGKPGAVLEPLKLY